MNERIRELAEQARKYAWENETHWSADAERATLFEQKFAELIVQECMAVAGASYMSTPEDCVYYVDLAVERVRKHFGVEE